MSWPLVAPAVVAVVVGLAAGRLQRHLSPPVAAAAYAAAAGLSAVAVGGAVVVLAALSIAQVSFVSDNLEWCRRLAADHTLPAWLGAGFVVGVVVMAASGIRNRPRRRRGVPNATAELVVLPSDEPEAYAVPGRPGHIVVSAGMLRRLDDDERRVLLAHERAHLRFHHHRYIAVADLAAGVVPMLRPLRQRVRFATERWADENAASEVGDRTLVARAICRAALAGQAEGALALAELGVPARVEAMLDADSVGSRRATAVSALTALFVVALSSSWQLHHLAAFASHVCGLS